MQMNPNKSPPISINFPLFTMSKFLLFISISAVATASDLVEVFGISRCPDTSKFIHNQLVPFYQNYKGNLSDGLKLDFHAVPTGGHQVDGKYVNRCLHGALECALNKLQMCSKKHIKQDWLVTAGCIQGKTAYSAGLKCLPDTEEGKIVQNCAESEEGEYLLNDENSYRYNVAPHSAWLPWIQVNGERNRNAEFKLKDVICQLESMKGNEICK
ncbi:Gamma-interferon-inducible lysosomal thiol reductase [Caenorhabditis elegans]|uniref:Gamma-interferon-inducible lysosomal thiol reductase n=1 Tax=Caenorhabditis elegans TaxID=6239 RepID=Q9XW24_CAEEL|nr:Gamma-interferon-inducible lysosomal thiol reductase [Caenorhabditis elegans]CAA22309.2 Gamma-interferon-inducible lysosomal thiol reductase [Caenorhabditis elegans]|eukprot:NP_493240.2 Uncharacterized protein CELE_Y18D10A.2 [Caenorhabditis elegans]